MNIKEKIIINCVCCLVLSCISNIACSKMHDPTVPVGKSLSDVAGIKIDAIIIGKNRKVVSIDGRQLVEGDKIRGAVIVDIQPDKVVFKDESGKFNISMAGSGIKTAPKIVQFKK